MLPPTAWLGRRDWGPAPPTTLATSPTQPCAVDLRVVLSCTPLYLQVISPIGLGLTNWMDSGLCMVAAIHKRYSAYAKATVMDAQRFVGARLRERFSWEFGSFPSLAEVGWGWN